MVKEPIDVIIKRYKRFSKRDAVIFVALALCSSVVMGLLIGFVLVSFQMPPQSGLGKLLTSIRALFAIPSEGFPPEVLVSRKAWLTYLSIGGLISVAGGFQLVWQAINGLDWLENQAGQFPSEESVKSVANVLFRDSGYLNRQASAELLTHAGDYGLSFLVAFLSPNLTKNDLGVAVVAAHSLGRFGTASAQAHLEKCTLEVDALQERLLAGESDRSNHHSIKEEIKKYQDAVRKALEQARAQPT